MRHGLRTPMTALVAALTLVSGLLLVAPAPALAPPGGIDQFPLSSMEDYPAGGLTTGSDGNVWFTEGSSIGGKIGLVTPEGKVLEYTIPTQAPATTEKPEHSYPGAIARALSGALWFIDVGTSSEGGQFIGKVTLKAGEGPTIKEFPILKENYLNQIAAGPDGNMWFTEGSSSGGRIGRITQTGEVTLYPPLPTQKSSSALPEYSNPAGIAQGPGGYMWFAEQGTTNEGRSFIGRIGTGIAGTTTGKVEEFPIPTKYSYPLGIAQGPAGNMWFSEVNQSQIGEIAPSGEVKEFPVPSLSYSPIGIAPGPDGNIWFSESEEAKANSIGRLAPSGEVKQFPLPTRESVPLGIVQGPDGNMWFIENGSTEVSPTPGLFRHIGRLTTPYLPASTSLPAVAGTATAGQVLTASTGLVDEQPQRFRLPVAVLRRLGQQLLQHQRRNGRRPPPRGGGRGPHPARRRHGHERRRLRLRDVGSLGLGWQSAAPTPAAPASSSAASAHRILDDLELRLVAEVHARGVVGGARGAEGRQGRSCLSRPRLPLLPPHLRDRCEPPLLPRAQVQEAQAQAPGARSEPRGALQGPPPERRRDDRRAGRQVGVGRQVVRVHDALGPDAPRADLLPGARLDHPGEGLLEMSARAHPTSGPQPTSRGLAGGRLLAVTLAGAVVVGLAVGLAVGAATKGASTGSSSTSLAPAIALPQAHVASVPAPAAVAVLPALHVAARPAAKAHAEAGRGASAGAATSSTGSQSTGQPSRVEQKEAPPVKEASPVEGHSGGEASPAPAPKPSPPPSKPAEQVHSGSGGGA